MYATDVKSGDVRRIDAEPLDSIHKSLLEMIQKAIITESINSVCAGYLLFEEMELRLMTPRPITSDDCNQIESAVRKSLAEHSDFAADTLFEIWINAQSRSDYGFPEYEPFLEIVHQWPVIFSGQTIGIFCVGGFCNISHTYPGTLVSEGSLDLSRLFRQVWEADRTYLDRYLALISKSVDGVLLCNKDKKILYITASARKMLKLAPDTALVGQPVSALKAAFLNEFLDEAMEGGVHELNKVISPNEKHSQLIGVHTELLRNPLNEEIGWMISLRDVTLNWQNDQMRSVLSIASHEIKTPLNSINGAVDLLLEKSFGPLTKEQHYCLSVVKDDIERLNRLLGDMLDLSRFDEGVQFLDRRKQVSLEFLVNRVIASFQEFARTKNIDLVARIPKSIPSFKGDRDRLQQVLVNLVENGIKYTTPGGAIEVSATLENSILKVWVKDTGVGIPASDLENIFKKFQRLNNYPIEPQRGYGLGLSIAKDIVVAYGGKIWVESEVGAGSTFYFTIPI